MANTKHTLRLEVEVEKDGEFPPTFSEAEQAVILAVGMAIAAGINRGTRITNIRAV